MARNPIRCPCGGIGVTGTLGADGVAPRHRNDACPDRGSRAKIPAGRSPRTRRAGCPSGRLLFRTMKQLRRIFWFFPLLFSLHVHAMPLNPPEFDYSLYDDLLRSYVNSDGLVDYEGL